MEVYVKNSSGRLRQSWRGSLRESSRGNFCGELCVAQYVQVRNRLVAQSIVTRIIVAWAFCAQDSPGDRVDIVLFFLMFERNFSI